jgi:hypothetical protein
MAGYVVPPGAGRSFGPGISVKVEPGASPSFAIMESVIPPFWAGPGLHLHRAYDEAVYVLDGTVTFTLDGVEHTCPAGSCVFMPRSVGCSCPDPARGDTGCPPLGRRTFPDGTGRTSRSSSRSGACGRRSGGGRGPVCPLRQRTGRGLRTLPDQVAGEAGSRPRPGSPPGAKPTVLAGRATHVPQAAVTSGTQRTATVTRTGSLSWLSAPDLGNRTAEKLHGMQALMSDRVR